MLQTDMEQIVGIKNLGETCYFSAILQAEMHSTPFYDILRGIPVESSDFNSFFEKGTSLHLAQWMQLIFAVAERRNERVLYVDEIAELIGIDPTVQDDANEVEKLIYDELQQYCELIDRKLGNTTVTRRFTDTLLSREQLLTNCSSCVWSSSADQRFSDITILPQGDFFATMRAYLDKSKIIGFECPECEGDVYQTPEFQNLADSVIFTVSKSKHKIQIPLYLDLNGLEDIGPKYYELSTEEKEDFLRVTMMPWAHKPESAIIANVIEENEDLAAYLSAYTNNDAEYANQSLYLEENALFSIPEFEKVPAFLYRLESMISQSGSENQGHYTSTVFTKENTKIFRAFYMSDAQFSHESDFRTAFLEAEGAFQANQQGYMYFFSKCGYEQQADAKVFSNLGRQYEENRVIISSRGGKEKFGMKETEFQECADPEEFALTIIYSAAGSPFENFDCSEEERPHNILEVPTNYTVGQLLQWFEIEEKCDIYQVSKVTEQLKRHYLCNSLETNVSMLHLFQRIVSSKEANHILLLDFSESFCFDALYVEFVEVEMSNPLKPELINTFSPKIEKRFFAEVDAEHLNSLAELISDDTFPIIWRQGGASMQILHLKLLYALHSSEDFEETLDICRKVILFDHEYVELGVDGYHCDMQEVSVSNGTVYMVEQCSKELPAEVFNMNYKLSLAEYSEIFRKLSSHKYCSRLQLFYKGWFLESISNPNIFLTIAQCREALAEHYHIAPEIELKFLTKTLSPFVLNYEDNETIEEASKLVANGGVINLQFEFLKSEERAGSIRFIYVPPLEPLTTKISIDYDFESGKSIGAILNDSFLKLLFEPKSAGYFVFQGQMEDQKIFNINTVKSNDSVPIGSSDGAVKLIIVPQLVENGRLGIEGLFRQPPHRNSMTKLLICEGTIVKSEIFYIIGPHGSKEQIEDYLWEFHQIQVSEIYFAEHNRLVRLIDDEIGYYHTLYVYTEKIWPEREF